MKRKIIVLSNLLEFTDAQWNMINQNPGLELIYKHSKELTEEDYQEAVAVIGNTSPERLKKFPNLEWVQLYSSGTNGYTEEGALKAGVRLTNATGSYGVAIAEHMLGQTLMLQKKFNLYMDKQRNEDFTIEKVGLKSIYGSTFIIVGYGDIGTAYGKAIKSLGGYVIGIKRNVYGDEQHADEVYAIEELDSVLGRGDVVATVVPGTLETFQLFNASRFRKMKDGAIFLNVGRGTAVDLNALCDALEIGKLSGAHLDVTDPEPLPKGHRAWKAPNLVITPHVSGNFYTEDTYNRFLEILRQNLENFSQNKSLINEVDFQTGYKKRT